MSKPFIYIFLGVTGAGRRTVVADLITRGMGEDDQVAVLTNEDSAGSDVMKTLALNPRVRLINWQLNEENHIVVQDDLASMDSIFFITHGKQSPVDQMESLVAWVNDEDFEVGRIFTVVDCGLFSTQPKLMPWIEACIHFSDVVCLNKRESVSQVWLKGFVERFQKEQCYPCLFENVKKGRVSDPAMLLHPEARRISHVFDERDAIYELGFDQDNLPDEPFELKVKEDPYFEKLPSGGRCKPIPDIRFALE